MKIFAILFIMAAAALAQGKKEPGVLATFSGGGKTDARVQRLAALYVAKGAAPTPFVPAGAWTAKLEGSIEAELRADYTFIVEVRGQVKVSINGEPVLDAAGAAAAQYADKKVQLKKGANAVVIEYRTDGEEDAQLRFDWAGREFPREPVPPSAWSHTGTATEGAKLREGRLLFATRNCAGCHDGGALAPKDGSGMLELMTTAPDLAEAGARFRAEWLAAWIENPRAVRGDATMPHLPLTKEQAGDIAAFLAGEGKPAAAKIAEDKAAKGGGLFGYLACVACHTTPDFAGKDDHGRIALGHVKAKYHPAALVEFLKLPAMHASWTRMPNFRLSDDEAGALAAYLLGAAKTEFPATKGDAARGKALVASAGCVSCHAIPGVEKSTLAAPALAAMAKTGGCLAEKPAKAPDFGFTPAQREALAAFLTGGLDSLKRDTFSEYAERQIALLNCAACHPRDGRQSTFQLVEGELAAFSEHMPEAEMKLEGTNVPPTGIPQLTWFGEKLQTGYMSSVIAGVIPVKPRPWLAARMPGFGGPGGGIANGLAAAHGFPVADFPEAAPDKARADIGAKLMGMDGGFNCTSCHGVKDLSASAIFEAPGINLGLTKDRIRKTWYARWMLAPQRVDAETKMTKFSEDGVTTQLGDVLDGKAAEQFGAIWEYLRGL